MQAADGLTVCTKDRPPRRNMFPATLMMVRPRVLFDGAKPKIGPTSSASCYHRVCLDISPRRRRRASLDRTHRPGPSTSGGIATAAHGTRETGSRHIPDGGADNAPVGEAWSDAGSESEGHLSELTDPRFEASMWRTSPGWQGTCGYSCSSGKIPISWRPDVGPFQFRRGSTQTAMLSGRAEQERLRISF